MSAAIQSRLRERRRRRHTVIAILAMLFIGFFSWGVVALMRAPFLRIQAIAAVGSTALSTSTLEQFAREKLSGDYWYVFPKDNILLYQKNKLETDLLSAFPELRDASVRSDTLTSITLSVSDREPRALWCGATAPSESSTPASCLLLDENGSAYGEAPGFSQPVYVAYYGPLSGGAAQLPAQFLTPDEFRSLAALVEALIQEANIGLPASVAIDENGDVHVRFGNGFTILFALRDDTGKIADHFTLALASAPFSTHPLSAFEYIDLRFGDKLYFKLK